MHVKTTMGGARKLQVRAIPKYELLLGSLPSFRILEENLDECGHMKILNPFYKKMQSVPSGYFGIRGQVHQVQRRKRWGIFQRFFGDSENINFRKPSLGNRRIQYHFIKNLLFITFRF